MLFQQTLFYFNNFYFLFILQLVSSCGYHNNNYLSYEASMYNEIHYTSEIALNSMNFSYIRKIRHSRYTEILHILNEKLKTNVTSLKIFILVI